MIHGGIRVKFPNAAIVSNEHPKDEKYQHTIEEEKTKQKKTKRNTGRVEVCSVKLLASTYRNAFRINVQTITFRRNFNEKRLACAERYDLTKRDGQIYVELRCRLCLCSVSFVFEYKQRIYYIKNFISEFSIIYFYVMYVQKRPRIVPFHETTSMCDVILRP